MTARPSPRTAWTWGWLVWLLGFLGWELSAARKEHGRPFSMLTLSRHVWRRWFPAGWQRVLFGLTLLALTAHLAMEWTVLPFLAGGAWMAATIGWVEIQRRRA